MRLNKRRDCIYIVVMKRSLLLLVVAALVVSPAFAFDPSRPAVGQITLLQEPLYKGSDFEFRIARGVREGLLRELRGRGFDVTDSRDTYADVQRDGRAVSGVFVELAPSDAYAESRGDVAVSGRNVGVDIAMLVSRVAAELRVYDGRTFELIAKRHLSKADVRVVPTGIGIGSYHMSVWFGLPIFQYARYRAAAQAVVKDAAAEIAQITGR